MRLVHEAQHLLTNATARSAWEKRRQGPTKIDPKQIAGQYLAQAKSLCRQGRRTDAVYSLEQAVEKAPDLVEPQLALSLLLLGNPRRRDECVAKLRKLASKHSSDPQVLAAFGLALDRTGKTSEAQKMFGQALSLNAVEPIAQAHRGDAAALQQVKKDPFLSPLFR